MTLKHQGNHEPENHSLYIAAVKQWADQILKACRDHYGKKYAPLFPDGIQVKTLEPLKWLSAGEEWVLANLASQQNFFRTLYGLSQLTGDDGYADAARDATSYALKHVRYGRLMAWGGHMAYDLQEKKLVHASDKGPQHELKCHYPFYELMFEVDPDETVAMIEAMWDSHITNWDNLEFNRHGQPRVPETDYGSGKVWDRDYKEEPVFFTARGLTFINAGSDLYYAAAFISSQLGLETSLKWAERLNARYTQTANPDTGMTGYQFSQSVLPGQRGDRAVDQFSELLPEDKPVEGKVSRPSQISTIVGKAALARMAMYDMLGERGRVFLDTAIQDQVAYGRYAYEAEDNEFHPVLTSGKRLTGLILDRDGYYGRKGEAMKAAKASPFLLWAYASGYRRSKHSELWGIVRSMIRGLGLGDIDESGLVWSGLSLEQLTTSEPCALLALLELAEVNPEGPYLIMAQRIGDNILRDRLHHGFFMPSEHHLYTKLDTIEPLVLLHLEAALRGVREQLPRYFGGSSFFSAAYDGRNHTSDSYFYYSLKSIP